MTAINVVKLPDRALMFSDAAQYDAAGVVQSFAPKVYPLPHLSAAFAARGPHAVLPLFGCEFSMRYSGFDELVDQIERDLPDLFNSYYGILAQSGFPEFELVFAGWLRRQDRIGVFVINAADRPAAERSDGEEGAGVFTVAPFHLLEIDTEIYFAPAPTEREMQESGCNRHSVTTRDGARAYGLTLLQAQRFITIAMPEGGDRHIVGGFAQVTEIRKDHVTSSIDIRWDDRIGEVIKPAPMRWEAWHRQMAADPSKPSFEGLSKLQRDMLERKQRKAASRR